VPSDELSRLFTDINRLRSAETKEKEEILTELCDSYLFPEILRRCAKMADDNLTVITLLFEVLEEIDLARLSNLESTKSYIEKALRGKIKALKKADSGISYKKELLRERDRAIEDLREELNR
jgi:hypothetical protein